MLFALGIIAGIIVGVVLAVWWVSGAICDAIGRGLNW
jgi:hypothetical protein